MTAIVANLLFAVGCNPAPGAVHGDCEECDIFGSDDRGEAYLLEHEPLRRAARAVGAVIRTVSLTETEDGTWKANDSTYGEREHLCSDVAFADQPAPADCSGFLVADDLFVTAGHCVDRSCSATADVCVERGCSDTSVTFDFAVTEAGVPSTVFPASNVYHCSELIVAVNESDNDFALLRLDRPVTGREPLAVESAPTAGANIVVLGHSSGLPLKASPGLVQPGAFTPVFEDIRDELPGFHSAEDLERRWLAQEQAQVIRMDADTFMGNSGGALVNAETGAVSGVVIWGAWKASWLGTHYELKTESLKTDSDALCNRPTVCGEDVECLTYPAAAPLSRFNEHLP